MPPKAARRNKKPELTPEQQAAEFEKWTKESEEYALLKEIQSVGTSLNWPNITELFPDLPLKTQPLLDVIMKIGPTFKVKNSKSKPITQEQLRVAWFAGERSRNEKFKVDGEEYQFPEQEINVDGGKIKSMVYSIWRLAFSLQSIQSDNFEKKRADLIKDYQDLIKAYKKFTKKGRGFFVAKSEQYMIKMLEPLQSLLMSNMGLTVIDFEYPSDTDYEVNNFRYKALIMQFCEAYMKVQTIIFQNPVMDALGKVIVKELKGNPDIYSVLKKFQYSDWRSNSVESFYIQPLLDVFLKLRANLSKLYLQGFNYWCIPLIENQQLFADMSEMQQCEETAEVIMGNRLQREQLNFLYRQVGIIYNSPGRKKLLLNDLRHSKMIILSIPQLVILKSLEQMHKVYMRKVKEKLEPDPIKRLEIDPPKPLIEFALLNSFDKKERTHQDLLPAGMVYKETIELANIGNIEIEINDNSIGELDKYGRYFIWYDYLPADRHEQMLEAAKILRNVNPAVIQDIEDNIIAQGMEATRGEFQNAQKAAEANYELLKMETDEKNNDVFKNRPPNLWNEPESLLDEHRFKFSAKPENAYRDNRVKDLLNHISDLAECLNVKPTKERWDRLVIRVIQVYQNKAQNE